MSRCPSPRRSLSPARSAGPHRLMQLQPPLCRDIRVDGLAVQVVGEPGSTGSAARTGQHPGANGVAHLGGDRRRPQVEDVAEHVGEHLVAGDRRGVEKPAAVSRDPVDAPGDEVTGGGWHHVGRYLGGQGMGELAHEEGVATGSTVDVLTPPFRHLAVPRTPEELSHLGHRKSLQPDVLGAQAQVGEQGGDIVGQLVVAVGAEQEQRHRAAGTHHEIEKGQ